MKYIIKKIFSLISSSEKRKMYMLVFLQVIATLLEMFGMSLIVELIALALNPSRITDSNLYDRVIRIGFVTSEKQLICGVAVMMAIVYIIKNVFLLWVYLFQTRTILDSKYAFQTQMLKKYLNRNYTYYLNADSGDIIRNINTDTNNLYSAVLAVVTLAKNVIVCIGLSAVILLLNPVASLIVIIVCALLVVLMNRFVKPYMTESGKTMVYAVSKAYKWLMQGIEGIKTVKVTRCEDFFEKQYTQNNLNWKKYEIKSQMYNYLPKIVAEPICMCSILGVFIFMIIFDVNLIEVLPLLSAFAYAAAKMIPNVNSINSSLNLLYYYEPSIDKLIEMRKEQPNYESGYDEMTHINAIENSLALVDLTYKYPTGNRIILNGANIEIPVGMSVGILGVSGAGKTTVMDLLLGLLKPSDGKVLVDGKAVNLNSKEWLKHVGYIPQNIFIMDGTIKENVAFGVEEEEVDEERIWECLRESQLEDYVNDLPDKLNTQVGERGTRLSGGQKQRLGIARALYNNPEILFFDEATSALDKETESALMESIECLHNKKTIIMIAHRESTLKSCDIIYRVADARITQEK